MYFILRWNFKKQYCLLSWAFISIRITAVIPDIAAALQKPELGQSVSGAETLQVGKEGKTCSLRIFLGH